MFGFFKKKSKKEQKVVQSATSVEYSSDGKRYLALPNSSCAILLHEDNQVEIVFTKLYNAETQSITDNEEQLMALALFMKQPGFLEMIVDEFRKLAKNQIENLTREEKE